MTTMIISDLPAGLGLLSDEESFLNDLVDEQENLIYGGSYKKTILIRTEPLPTPPVIEPCPKPWPVPVPTPPIPAPWPKPSPTPPIQYTHPIFIDPI